MRFSTIIMVGSIFEIPLRIHLIFSPYIAHERTAQNLIFPVHSSLFALFLITRLRSQDCGSLKSEERLSDFKERCAQLWNSVVFVPALYRCKV